jgi:Xaa-Pro dipeptidase
MRQRDDMTFSQAEYSRRLSELRERMERRLLDAVIISTPANLMYLTDYQTTGYSFFQCLVVPLEKEPFMITRQMEESNVIKRTWVELTRPYSDTGDAMQMLYTSLREFGLGNKVVGYERNSYFFSAYLQDRIHAAFDIGGRLIDCFGIVEEGRKCKSDEEIQLMERAATATEAGMKAGLAAIEPGVTENEIAAEICRAMFAAGGEYPAVLPYVTSGPRTMIGHATWEGRVVEPGEHVFLEVGGCVRRYHTAMMRTALTGDMSEAMAHAEQVMIEALYVLHETARPGVTVADIDNAIRRVISRNEVNATLITRAGYSIGIAFPPSWDEGYMLSIKPGDPTFLEPGMTFHIIPWMWGVEGDKTCGISDTIVITDDGCRSLFSLEREFTVLGKRLEPSLVDSNARSADSKKADSKKADSDKADSDKAPSANSKGPNAVSHK